jgi:hypothetical protein
MPSSDQVTFDGKKHDDGSFDATVFLSGQPCGDPALTVTGGTEEQVQQLWYRVKAKWPDVHLGSGVLECVTRGVSDRNMDGL